MHSDAMRLLVYLLAGSGVSGLVAFLGNKLGRHVGRRKMSLFGLRPKYTSNLITVFTGSMIFLITLGLAAAASSNVRTFLEGIDKLQAKRDQLQAEVATMSRKIAAGPLLMPDQPMSVGVIECGVSEDQEKEQIDTLLALANRNAILLNNQEAEVMKTQPLDENTHLVGYDKREKSELIQSLAKMKGTVVCQVVVFGEPVYPGDKILGRFLLGRNALVFHKGEVIVSGKIDGTRPSELVYNQVHDLLYKDLQFKAFKHGMVRNPLTSKLDTSIDEKQMSETSAHIADLNKPALLQVVANSDIYTLGPLDARMVVQQPAANHSAAKLHSKISALIH
jgi:uncharacterized protein (DUF3084 family)